MEYGLIGLHLGHSFSKDIHEKLSAASYTLRELTPEELPRFLAERDFQGINVTIPYKEAVIPHLDYLSDEARRIGAVNTIVCRDGRLEGYNTDYFGFGALADSAGIRFEGRRTLILGAGGAAKTVATFARDRGAREVVHAVRTVRAGDQRLLSGLGSDEPYEIIVNCTPVGMFPQEDGSAVDLGCFPALEGALDLIYNPLRTDFILDAQARGIPAQGGLLMLIAQAVKARELFDGSPLPDYLAASLCEEMTRSKRNIVLVGMPASGKSTIGRALSSRSGRPFVDTDTLIVERTGKPIREIFATEGEAAFRKIESDIIREVSCRTGIILATGGGAILDPANVRRLRRGGLLFRIDRGLEQSRTSPDRPLSPDTEALRALYEQRRQAYERATDILIDNHGPLAATLHAFDPYL